MRLNMQEEARLWKVSYNRIFIIKLNGPLLPPPFFLNGSMMFENVLSGDGVEFRF